MAANPAPGARFTPAVRSLRRINAGVFRWLAGVLAAALMALPASGADDTVTLNFVNADIDAVVKAVSEITGRNFIVDPKIKGTVNIISARPSRKVSFIRRCCPH